MKKLILFSALLIFGSPAFSDTSQVKITSFAYASGASGLAELCGQVIGATALPSFIRVTVDPRGKHPASYNTVAGKDGNFCMTVITYTGEANADLL